jgi:hypothetical protein
MTQTQGLQRQHLHPILTGENGFRRGPYGEILPPRLIEVVTPTDLAMLLLELTGAEAVSDNFIHDPFYQQIALDYAHQQRLLQIFGGGFVGDPAAAALYLAVMRGEPLSLRPLGQEGTTYRTFAPVLQRVGDETWRVGRPEDGRWLQLSGQPAVVLRRARQLYIQWAGAEQEAQ